jgi:hypothetical protein
MLDFRPLPHQPLAGSVRPQDVPRLRKLRGRLTRRWARAVQIRLTHVERRMAAHRRSPEDDRVPASTAQ